MARVGIRGAALLLGTAALLLGAVAQLAQEGGVVIGVGATARSGRSYSVGTPARPLYGIERAAPFGRPSTSHRTLPTSGRTSTISSQSSLGSERTRASSLMMQSATQKTHKTSMTRPSVPSESSTLAPSSLPYGAR